MNNEVPSLTIRELFENSNRYVIPVYQRNYAWTDSEITQLIQDIWDCANNESNSEYYIGSLIVFNRMTENEIIYETIDGQQRLTTLSIVMSVLHREFKISNPINYNLSLEFDSRKTSTETIKAITSSNNKLIYSNNKDYNFSIQHGYSSVIKSLKKIVGRNDQIEQFYRYLISSVRIIRVSVPEKTDLNHYFEIMNNRGEQLEKHEILKAKLLNEISSDNIASQCFNQIWEACSDMERYIQYGFTVDQRHSIFGENDWANLCVQSFDELALLIANSNKNSNKVSSNSALSILEIAESKKDFTVDENQKEDSPERFSTVVNFPNFLLHVLRVFTAEDISLDDKKLLNIFLQHLEEKKRKGESENFVKEFGFALLRCKMLFDHFIIKREYIREKEQWSLKRLKWNHGNKVSYINSFEEGGSTNREIIMLLSMFHVSTPTMVYKHWLNAALKYLHNEHEHIDQIKYKNYLEELARSFLFDRFIAKHKPLEYYEIIYINHGVRLNKSPHLGDYNFESLDRGTYVENFVFNYLDYILWQRDGKKNSFDFTFRSSVEHFYPQNPIAEEHRIDQKICDLFGNLCLISQSKNSKLSNLLPSGKIDFYRDSKVVDSLKQQLMMATEGTWNENNIIAHGQQMKRLLLTY